MTKHDGEHTTIKYLLLLLIALLLLLLTLRFGTAQVTVTDAARVPITCSDQGQCIAITNGVPIFFPGTNATLNLTVPYSYSYEPNTTLNVQNITIVQNVTNLTVTTQNVTVVNCNQTQLLNMTSTDLAQGIVANMNDSISNSCRKACSLSDSERTLMQGEVRDAKVQLNATVTQYESQLNISRTDYEHLNQTCTAEKEAISGTLTSFQILCALLLCLFLGGLGYMIWQSRRPVYAAGEKSARAIRRGGEE